MRIVYLHQYFRTPEMSGGTRSYEWASRLAARGHEVHVVTSDSTGDPNLPTRPLDGVQVHWVPVHYDNAMSLKERLWSFIRFAALASKRARRLDPDLVVATSTPAILASRQGARGAMVDQGLTSAADDDAEILG